MLLKISEYMDKFYYQKVSKKQQQQQKERQRVSETEKQHLKYKRKKISKYIEIYIWESFMNMFSLVPDESHSFISLNLGDFKFKINETLCSQYVSVDKQNDMFVDISIDFINSVQMDPQLVGKSYFF